MFSEIKRILAEHPLTSLALFIIGAVSTFAVEKFIERWIKKINVKKLKIKLTKESLDSMNDFDLFGLAHGSPYWKNEDVELSNSRKKLTIKIPEELRENLINNDPKFEFRPTHILGFKNFEDMGKSMEIADLELRIQRNIPIVVDELIEKQNAGRLTFNGEMLGVYNIFRDNTPKVEYRKLRIQTYDTDFFTYRLFASIYKELKDEDHKISKVIKLEEIIVYKPFLSSFGLCTFVTLYNQTEILLAKRSIFTTHNDNRWHYSMNEAFSQTDFDEDDVPDLFKCHVRGLQEELNINPRISKKTIYFLDLLFDRDRFEIGITSLIHLEDFAFKDLEFFYKCAKDGEIETDAIEMLAADKKVVKNFMKENEMTRGARLGLQLLMARVLTNTLPPSQEPPPTT